MAIKTKIAIFIDKDGTLIRDIPYNVDPGKIEIPDEVIRGLLLLQQIDPVFIVITNQSGVARGYFSEEDLIPVYKRINDILADYSLSISAFYHCPHLKDAQVRRYALECDCRKPKSGLIKNAANDFNIDLNISWMIGDILNDVEAGNRAGCKTVLVNNGNEKEWLFNQNRLPTIISGDFENAAKEILYLN